MMQFLVLEKLVTSVGTELLDCCLQAMLIAVANRSGKNYSMYLDILCNDIITLSVTVVVLFS